MLNSWNMVKIAINNRRWWEKVHHITYNPLTLVVKSYPFCSIQITVLASDFIIIPSQWFYFSSNVKEIDTENRNCIKVNLVLSKLNWFR